MWETRGKSYQFASSVDLPSIEVMGFTISNNFDSFILHPIDG